MAEEFSLASVANMLRDGSFTIHDFMDPIETVLPADLLAWVLRNIWAETGRGKQLADEHKQSLFGPLKKEEYCHHLGGEGPYVVHNSATSPWWRRESIEYGRQVVLMYRLPVNDGRKSLTIGEFVWRQGRGSKPARLVYRSHINIQPKLIERKAGPMLADLCEVWATCGERTPWLDAEGQLVEALLFARD